MVQTVELLLPAEVPNKQLEPLSSDRHLRVVTQGHDQVFEFIHVFLSSVARGLGLRGNAASADIRA